MKEGLAFCLHQDAHTFFLGWDQNTLCSSAYHGMKPPLLPAHVSGPMTCPGVGRHLLVGMQIVTVDKTV